MTNTTDIFWTRFGTNQRFSDTNFKFSLALFDQGTKFWFIEGARDIYEFNISLPQGNSIVILSDWLTLILASG